jgi:metallo-beta-lactamase superfamily protein
MGTLKAPASGVTVRMYRQGLGDCFLLAFASAQPEIPFYMLIDCGVVLGTPATSDKPAAPTMSKVVASLKEATDGKIDLLVITHEHWDHVSGFLQVASIFHDFQIKDLWFAWTEDPADELAHKLKTEFAKDLRAMHLAVHRAADQQAMEQIANVLGFFGEAPSLGAGAAPAPNTTGAAFEAVRKLVGKQPGYRRPGEPPLPLPGVAGVRVYILGPPHDERLLRRINPTAKGKEVYTEGLTARTAFLMAARGRQDLSDADRELQDMSFPFESRLRIPPEEAKSCTFFNQYYGSGDDPAQSWRRIDDDWLGTAGEIALQLDSYTNNTSLALAIELDSAKVLLFVADAQVGNWLSWDSLRWPVPDDQAKTINVGIADLLARTVLYKVGHHGSHNATIRGEKGVKKGLELMTHPDLVAMIPVDHQMAVKKHWGKMPFDPLLDRLDAKTAHRVLRVDDPYPKPKPAAMSSDDWTAFKTRFKETELYMEYTVGNG